MASDKLNNYISLRDKEFLGPDKQLEQLLKQRMTVPTHVAAELHSVETGVTLRSSPTYKQAITIKENQEFRRWGKETTTISTEATRKVREFNSYNAEDLKPKILRFQQYLIQLTKGFIEEVDEAPVVKKIEKDERTRIATVFAKLDQWIMRMRTLHQSTLNVGFKRTYVYIMPVSRRPQIHFYYYEHILRSHIDITYTVEFINHIHQRSVTGVKRQNASRVRGKKKDRNDGDDGDDAEDQEAELEAEMAHLSQLYDKYQGKEVSEEQQQYIAEMLEAGLEPTDPP